MISFSKPSILLYVRQLFTSIVLHRFVCDELDGRFARLYNQTSQFGAVLDMVTDRCVTVHPLSQWIIASCAIDCTASCFTTQHGYINNKNSGLTFDW